jgi:hypothetical protein
MDFDDDRSGFVREATPEPNEPLVEPRPEQPDQQSVSLPVQPHLDEIQEQVAEEDENIPAIVVQRPSRNRQPRDDDHDNDNVVVPPKRRRLRVDKEVKLSNAVIRENFDNYEVDYPHYYPLFYYRTQNF